MSRPDQRPERTERAAPTSRPRPRGRAVATATSRPCRLRAGADTKSEGLCLTPAALEAARSPGGPPVRKLIGVGVCENPPLPAPPPPPSFPRTRDPSPRGRRSQPRVASVASVALDPASVDRPGAPLGSSGLGRSLEVVTLDPRVRGDDVWGALSPLPTLISVREGRADEVQSRRTGLTSHRRVVPAEAGTQDGRGSHAGPRSGGRTCALRPRGRTGLEGSPALPASEAAGPGRARSAVPTAVSAGAEIWGSDLEAAPASDAVPETPC